MMVVVSREIAGLVALFVLAFGGIAFGMGYAYTNSVETVKRVELSNAAGLQRLATHEYFRAVVTYGSAVNPHTITNADSREKISRIVASIEARADALANVLSGQKHATCFPLLCDVSTQWMRFTDAYDIAHNLSLPSVSPQERDRVRHADRKGWGVQFGTFVSRGYNLTTACTAAAHTDRTAIEDMLVRDIERSLIIQLVLLSFVSVVVAMGAFVALRFSRNGAEAAAMQSTLEMFRGLNHDIKNGAIAVYTYADSLIEGAETVCALARIAVASLDGDGDDVIMPPIVDTAITPQTQQQLAASCTIDQFCFEVEQLRSEAEHTVSCIQVLALRHLGSLDPSERKLVNVNSVVQRVVARGAPRVRLVSTPEAPFTTKTHQAALSSIVHNMVQNALNHGKSMGDVDVEVRPQQSERPGDVETGRGLSCEVVVSNCAGNNHAYMRWMYADCLATGNDFFLFLRQTCSNRNNINNNTNRNAIGQRNSTFRGLDDMGALADLLGMQIQMQVRPGGVTTSLLLTRADDFNAATRAAPLVCPPAAVLGVASADDAAVVHVNTTTTSPTEATAAIVTTTTTNTEPTTIFIDDQAASRLGWFACLKKVHRLATTTTTPNSTTHDNNASKTDAQLQLLDRQLVYRDGPVHHILGHLAKHCSAEYVHDVLLRELRDRGTAAAIVVIDQNLDTEKGLILGTDIATQLRNNSPFREHLLLVARSANMTAVDKEMYLAAGFDECVDKAEPAKALAELVVTLRRRLTLMQMVV